MSLPTQSDPYFPELVFCLCAAVGTDTKMISDALSDELRAVGYTPVPIRLSKLMTELPGFDFLNDLTAEDERIRESMNAGNEIRRIIGHADAVVRLALTPIRDKRADLNSGDPLVMAERHCFIVSSLKREEELETLRTLFGQRLFLVSVYEPKEARIENLCRNIAISKNSSNPAEFEDVAKELVGIAPTRFLELFEMVSRKDDQGYAVAPTAPQGGPKCVASGSLVSGYESEYLASVGEADWTTFQRLPSGGA